MSDFQEGMFVRVWPTGEIGMIMTLDQTHADLMFVNNGPYIGYKRLELIPATRKQIIAAGLDGVGCVEPPE